MPTAEPGEQHAEEARWLTHKQNSAWRRKVQEKGNTRKDQMNGLTGQETENRNDMLHAFRTIMARDFPEFLPTLSNFFRHVNPNNLEDKKECQRY